MRWEPVGFRANLYGHALVAATVANTVPRANGRGPFKPADFMPEGLSE